MKKWIAILLTLVLATTVLSACSGKKRAPVENGKADKLSIVTTIFPEYDWVRAVLGEKAENTELTMLLDSGVDLHSYQPTAEDLIKVANCDMFIYVGGESDDWVEDALANADKDGKVVMNLLETLGNSVKEEEEKEGMEAEAEEHAEEEGPEYDEHIWLSLKNAQVIVTKITEALSKIDAENASVYTSNAERYNMQLAALDAQYQETADNASVKTLLFADRFPFRYLTDDYGLDYYAAFAGCSAESEASFETVSFLAKKSDELSLKYVMTIEGSDGKLANTVIDNSENKDKTVLSLNSMQSVTELQVQEGASYIEIMKANLDVLRKALS